MAPTAQRAILLAGLLVLALIGCGHDAADQQYLAALRGEETGMTREEQVALMTRAIALAPKRAYYYETRGGYYVDLKQFDLALVDLDRDIALVDRPYARFFRGLVTCQAGNAAGSLGDFDTAIARQPANTQFYRGRSLARAAIGDAAGALTDAEHLVATVPQQAESYYARGTALAMLHRDREAVADFDRAAAMRPELAYVVEARALAYARMGDRTRALADSAIASRIRSEQSGCAACTDPFRY